MGMSVTGLRTTAARRLAAAALMAILSGCANYAPLPLSTQMPLRSTVSALDQADTDTTAPLTVADIVRLAVANNPDLKAARAQQGVAEAQLLQAGLLPNPSVNGLYTPVLSGPGVTPAWSAGLSEDIRSLITLASRRKAAAAAAQQVSATILWQEWQLMGKARLLVIQIAGDERMAAVLRETQAMLAQRYDHTRHAVATGDADLTALSPDLTALGDVEKQIDDLDRQRQTHRHDLNALLGLAPGVPIRLAPVADPPEIDHAKIQSDLAFLADRRPDLIALRLGYTAQDAKLRSAILAQFPALNIGLTGGSDNSNVRTIGPQITLELPIFDRNQGNIAIERATRQQLHNEFRARLATAESEAGALLDDISLTRRQLPPLRARTQEARRMGKQAEAAFAAGNLTERAYVDFISARLARQQELLGLEQSLREQHVALDTLIGAGMPVVSLPKETQ
ncbi:MAG: TolC family protein [Rhodopila sp.]|nr:TolC family protein [Rhodopila sp.]